MAYGVQPDPFSPLPNRNEKIVVWEQDYFGNTSLGRIAVKFNVWVVG